MSEEKSKIYPKKISEIYRYMSLQMAEMVGDGDTTIAEGDNITSFEAVVGILEKGGVASIGKAGRKFAGKENIVELFYSNENGTIVIAGAGATSDINIKQYQDSKKIGKIIKE